MTMVMRGIGDITERQFAAACAAAPYVHPRLSVPDGTLFVAARNDERPDAQ
jgi:hypothetical protein